MFGIFGGKKIDIKLEKFNYLPGEVIRGTVVLDLKKPVKAKKLVVSLYAYREINRTARISFGPTTSRTRDRTYERQVVYNYELVLDGEKEYSGRAEYNFEIGIPADVRNIVNMQPQLPNNMISTFAKVAMFMSGAMYTPLRWFVEAKLDVPFGMDIRKTVQITIVDQKPASGTI